MRVVVSATPQKAALLAARFIGRRLREGIDARGAATLALSGGATAPLLHAQLARVSIEWAKVHVFQVDERVAPAGDAARNLVAIAGALGGVVPDGRLHAMPVEADDLDSAAGAYAQDIRAVAGEPPVLDVVHLGLGTDGHTASLFPGDGALSAPAPVACTGEQGGFRRMTLTLPLINAARNIIWFVTGEAKRPSLARLATRGWEMPAGRVARRRAVIYADRAARAA